MSERSVLRIQQATFFNPVRLTSRIFVVLFRHKQFKKLVVLLKADLRHYDDFQAAKTHHRDLPDDCLSDVKLPVVAQTAQDLESTV